MDKSIELELVVYCNSDHTIILNLTGLNFTKPVFHLSESRGHYCNEGDGTYLLQQWFCVQLRLESLKYRGGLYSR